MSTPARDPILAVDGLTRRFGTRVAVDGVSFRIGAGESVGLLGPNGAGKTTTVGLICGLLRPTAGEVRIAGRSVVNDADPLKSTIGLVPQELALMEPLTARANLELCGALYGLHGRPLAQAIDEALAFVGLSDRAKDRAATFSGGMKRRLNIAAALLHKPTLLFLDEPTVGVDPQSRNAIFENVEALRRQGTTIIYTTHYMEEVERLCDRVIIMDQGRVIADDTLAGLRTRAVAGTDLVFDLEVVPEGLVANLGGLPGVHSAEVIGNQLRVRVDAVDVGLSVVLPELMRREARILHVGSARPSLESIFLQLTGRSLRDG